VEVLSRGVRDPQDHSIIRTCDQIYAQLDAVAGALDVLAATWNTAPICASAVRIRRRCRMAKTKQPASRAIAATESHATSSTPRPHHRLLDALAQATIDVRIVISVLTIAAQGLDPQGDAHLDTVLDDCKRRLKVDCDALDNIYRSIEGRCEVSHG
jgi:hypothetical protein